MAMKMDLGKVETPCYVCDIQAIRSNLEVLRQVQERTGCRILLALKGFATFAVFPLMRSYLVGTCASSLDEARLGFEEFGGEVHTYGPAYRDSDFLEILKYSDYVIFNSFCQWRQRRPQVEAFQKKVSCGIRINPEHREVKTEKYDPCQRYSRLGVPLSEFEADGLEGIEGLHFHTLCEQNVDSLARTLEAVESKFGKFFNQMKWANFGGGHHITREDYDVDLLCKLITEFSERHGVQVYLEPGEAVVLNAGYFVARVLDIVHNEMDIAILDTSVSAHLPDVQIVPYRPTIVGAGLPGEHLHTYKLTGASCLAGDIVGDYSFPKPLKAGDKLVFTDMAHYTMVKNNTFNGIRLPSIATCDSESGELKVIKRFGYEDYRNRLS